MRALGYRTPRYLTFKQALDLGGHGRKRGQLAERADEIAKVTPLGRASGDYDIKGPVVFFASEASRHVSGRALAIDGGGSAVILN